VSQNSGPLARLEIRSLLPCLAVFCMMCGNRMAGGVKFKPGGVA
jgi:hypothetical protein